MPAVRFKLMLPAYETNLPESFTNRNTADLVLVLEYSFLKILPGNFVNRV